jgi:hypothetical protein
MQTPLQSCLGATQVLVTHWLFTHASPAGQALKQLPQLLGSLVKSTQLKVQVALFTQSDSLAGQSIGGSSQEHTPPKHCWLAEQGWLQPPQFWLLLEGSMHTPLHSRWPG